MKFKLYLALNIAFSLFCACAVAAEVVKTTSLDKRFNLTWTITIPAKALSVTGKDPDFPMLKLPSPEVQPATDFWIKKSSLNAQFGSGVGCANRKFIQVGLLSYSRADSEKVYAQLQKLAKSSATITLSLVGNADYLKFAKGEVSIPECVLFLKTWKPISMSAASPDPSHVKSDLQHLPAKKVISNLKKRGEFELILKRIDEGDAQWIALAPSLYKGTDAGDSEDIEIALATALPKNALAVLSALNGNTAISEGQPRIDKVCGVPFIEPTDRFIQKYLKESTAALKAVSDEKLLPLAKKCLGYLK